MRRVTIPEYGQIICWRRKTSPPEATARIAYLEEPLFRRLEKSEQQLSQEGKTVFSWYRDAAQAQQWVGVIQVPGLQVEILPKIDTSLEAASTPEDEGQWHEARSNLLYMLAVAGDIPIRSRDVARLATRRAPLNETLAALFANQLLEELLRGCERSYVAHEENLRSFKGRLMVGKQLLKNTAHRERFYCRYDQFSENTTMNQVFKAACRFLLGTTRTPGTQDALRHCLLVLESVSNEMISPAHFKKVTFTRQNERFAELFDFCRLILEERAPTVISGEDRSYSLLFDMNKVFERFIAAFLHERVMPSLPDCRLFPHACHNRRSLFQEEGLRGVLLLAPDILISHKELESNLVIDTKWKNLNQSRLADGDLYQLHAYTHRYGCGQSILLYPMVQGGLFRDLHVLDENHQRTGRRVSIRFVNMHRDLNRENERKALGVELACLVKEGMGLVTGGYS